MATGIGFLNIGRVSTSVRLNEKIYSPSIAGAYTFWPVSPNGLWGKGPNGNHPNIPEFLGSGQRREWDRLFQGDKDNNEVTRKICTGISYAALQKIKNINTSNFINEAQYDSGINQYRFYNWYKLNLSSKYGVSDASIDPIISHYEQAYGKSLEKYVYIDVYHWVVYDDSTKNFTFTGTPWYYPAFPHRVRQPWHPKETQFADSIGWNSVVDSTISTANFYTAYSNPDPNFNGFAKGEHPSQPGGDYKISPNTKHHWTWNSFNSTS
ncbi:hypothetical protein EBU71_19220 [bacterium]|nr:hypothetical protein [Candidatus Elulimicrobium humile]